MKRSKRWLALLMTLCLLTGLMAVPARAAGIELFATAADLKAEAEKKKAELDAANAALKKAEDDLAAAEGTDRKSTRLNSSH